MGFSEVVWSLESDSNVLEGPEGYSEFGVLVSIVSESRRMVRTELEEQ